MDELYKIWNVYLTGHHYFKESIETKMTIIKKNNIKMKDFYDYLKKKKIIGKPEYKFLFELAIKNNDLDSCKYLYDTLPIDLYKTHTPYIECPFKSSISQSKPQICKWIISKMNCINDYAIINNVLKHGLISNITERLNKGEFEYDLGIIDIYMFFNKTIQNKEFIENKTFAHKEFIDSYIHKIKEIYINEVLLMLNDTRSHIYYLTHDLMFDMNIFTTLIPEYLFY